MRNKDWPLNIARFIRRERARAPPEFARGLKGGGVGCGRGRHRWPGGSALSSGRSKTSEIESVSKQRKKLAFSKEDMKRTHWNIIRTAITVRPRRKKVKEEFPEILVS